MYLQQMVLSCRSWSYIFCLGPLLWCRVLSRHLLGTSPTLRKFPEEWHTSLLNKGCVYHWECSENTKHIQMTRLLSSSPKQKQYISENLVINTAHVDQFSLWICQWKNCENWSTFAEVITKNQMYHVFLEHGVQVQSMFIWELEKFSGIFKDLNCRYWR